ncbi:MAG: ThiF family adenylyltransferase [Bacteroidetes bacterium]|nr:ThiF family adenylyltransferase [Bacteroidota bacterium]
MLKPEEIARYGRQILLPGFERVAQEKLKNTRVLVVGAGGLGVPLLQYLCGMGVGTLGVVDDDNVEESNLHRQVIYQQGDVGRVKVKAIKERLPKLNPYLKLEVYAERLTTRNARAILEKYDIIADGSDNFQTKYLVNDLCVELGKPLVHGSVLGFDGQLSVFNLRDKKGNPGPNYRDLFPELPENVPDCNIGGVLGVVPGIIGSLMALEVAKLAAGIGEPLSGRILQFDGLRHRFVTVALASLPAKDKAPAVVPEEMPEAQEALQQSPVMALPQFVEGAALVEEPLPEPALQEPDPLLVHNEEAAEEPALKPGLFVAQSESLLPEEEDEDILTPVPVRRRMVQTLKPLELEEWGEKEVPFSLIDVREPNEHQIVNIGGRLIPFTRLESNLSRFRPDVTYVIYCKNGTRSLIAAEMLLAHGVQNVYTLEGGILRYIREVAPELQTY